MPNCCLKSCKNRGSLHGITYHKIPFRMKDEWNKILNKYGTKYSSIHNAVCSDHFRPEDLDKDGFRVVLKKGVVPSLYLDGPKSKKSSNQAKKCTEEKPKLVYKKRLQEVDENPDEDRGEGNTQVERTESSTWFRANEVEIIDIGQILGRDDY